MTFISKAEAVSEGISFSAATSISRYTPIQGMWPNGRGNLENGKLDEIIRLVAHGWSFNATAKLTSSDPKTVSKVAKHLRAMKIGFPCVCHRRGIDGKVRNRTVHCIHGQKSMEPL